MYDRKGIGFRGLLIGRPSFAWYWCAEDKIRFAGHGTVAVSYYSHPWHEWQI